MLHGAMHYAEHGTDAQLEQIHMYMFLSTRYLITQNTYRERPAQALPYITTPMMCPTLWLEVLLASTPPFDLPISLAMPGLP